MTLSLSPGSCQGSTPNHFQFGAANWKTLCSNTLLRFTSVYFLKGLDQILALSKCLLLSGLVMAPRLPPLVYTPCIISSHWVWAEPLHMWAHDSRAEVTHQLTLNSLKGSLSSGPGWITPLCLGVEIRGRKRMIWSKTGPVEGATWQRRQTASRSSEWSLQSAGTQGSQSYNHKKFCQQAHKLRKGSWTLERNAIWTAPLFQLCETLSRGPSLSLEFWPTETVEIKSDYCFELKIL